MNSLLQLSSYALSEEALKMFASPFDPFLFYSSSNHLHLYHLKKYFPINTIPIYEQENQVSHLSLYQNKMIYSLGNYIFINSKKLFHHKNSINQLLSDQHGLVLAASADATVSLISASKQQKLAELSPHLEAVTALDWHRSLCIAGDRLGEVYLWDINKCKTVAQRKIHQEEVNYIGHYVDFSKNNLYFSVSKNQKRIVFSDLRTNKKVHITNGLPIGIKNVLANESGKIFINSRDNIYLVDIYSNFNIIKVFKSNEIKQEVILGKYYMIGCQNGCIYVYNSDLLELEHVQKVGESAIRGLEISQKKELLILSEDANVMGLEL